MNSITIIGNLTKEPEARFAQNGVQVTSFTVAVNRPGTKLQDGTWKDNGADFFNVVTWEGLAERCGNNLAKGMTVEVQGEMRSRTYETNEGQKRIVWEVKAGSVYKIERLRNGGGGQVANNDPAAGFGEVVPDEQIQF